MVRHIGTTAISPAIAIPLSILYDIVDFHHTRIFTMYFFIVGALHREYLTLCLAAALILIGSLPIVQASVRFIAYFINPVLKSAH